MYCSFIFRVVVWSMARDSTEGDDQDNNSGDVDILPEHDLNDPPIDSLLAPPVVSNRNIGSGRSRSRHRHRHHRRRGLLRFKRKESNFIAAVCSMIVLVLMCIALAEPQWFYLSGGGCKDSRGNVVNYLGVNLFFYVGKIQETSHSIDQPRTTYKYGEKDHEGLTLFHNMLIFFSVKMNKQNGSIMCININ